MLLVAEKDSIPMQNIEFHDVLTITNRVEDIYVWLESPDWGTPHTMD